MCVCVVFVGRCFCIYSVFGVGDCVCVCCCFCVIALLVFLCDVLVVVFSAAGALVVVFLLVALWCWCVLLAVLCRRHFLLKVFFCRSGVAFVGVFSCSGGVFAVFAVRVWLWRFALHHYIIVRMLHSSHF